MYVERFGLVKYEVEVNKKFAPSSIVKSQRLLFDFIGLIQQGCSQRSKLKGRIIKADHKQ